MHLTGGAEPEGGKAEVAALRVVLAADVLRVGGLEGVEPVRELAWVPGRAAEGVHERVEVGGAHGEAAAEAGDGRPVASGLVGVPHLAVLVVGGQQLVQPRVPDERGLRVGDEEVAHWGKAGP